jgi:hypothetical protein
MRILCCEVPRALRSEWIAIVEVRERLPSFSKNSLWNVQRLSGLSFFQYQLTVRYMSQRAGRFPFEFKSDIETDSSSSTPSV